MGLNSGMAKIIGYTNKMMGFTSVWSTHANVPSSSFMRVMGIEGDLSFNSVSDLRNSISQLRSGAALGINAIRCGWELLGPQGLQFLGQLIEGVGGVIGTIADEIMDAVSIQVSMAAQQIIGCVTSVVDALLNLVSSVLLLTDIINDMIDSWTDWSDFNFDLYLKES
jgi:hypothetical protein